MVAFAAVFLNNLSANDTLYIDLDNSHGSWVVDGQDGSEYLDMFSMFASGAVGYNHPYIVKNKEILGNISINKTTLSDMYNEYYAEFIKIFHEFAMPKYLQKAFFIDGGSLAVENALKVAFDWKVRINLQAGRGELGGKIIHFREAFHGRSGYTLSLTNTSDPRKTMYFPGFIWHWSFGIDILMICFSCRNIIY